MQTDRKIAPTYTVPLAVLGMILFFVTLFGGVFAILPFIVQEASTILEISAAVAALIVLLSWFGLVRTWRTRRMFSGCRVSLADGFVIPGRLCRFTVEDLGHCLTSRSCPSITLSYQDEFRRSGGRKVYRHGPYALNAEVHTTLLETHSLPVVPVVEGQFTLQANQIKFDVPDRNWESRTFVILTLKANGGRCCKFELPCTIAPGV